MGAVRLIYDESTRQFKRLGWWGELKLEGVRKIVAGSLRYCLQNNTLYLPEDQSVIEQRHRLCWGRIRVEEIEEKPWLGEFDCEVPEDPLQYHQPFTGTGFGIAYSRRHMEVENSRIPVSEFIAQALIDNIAENPEALLSVSKREFELLIAELFVRKGFDVDLFRVTKDDGIDFLAVQNEDTKQPIIYAVQTKHPDIKRNGEKRNTLPVSTVREVYGVCKAMDLHGAIAITSSTYSPEAKKFSEMKPDEIELADASNIYDWIKKYRWNHDE